MSGRGNRQVRWLVALVCVVFALLAAAVYARPYVQEALYPPEPEMEGSPSAFLQTLCNDVADDSLFIVGDAFERSYDAWFRYFSESKVIPVDASPDAGGPRSFGPWDAVADYGAAEARSDGSLTEWSDGYYITHDWSEYGRQILSMRLGDALDINGRALEVERIFNYPKASYLEQLRTIAGDDAVVLQTCYPDSDQNRIVVCV